MEIGITVYTWKISLSSERTGLALCLRASPLLLSSRPQRAALTRHRAVCGYGRAGRGWLNGRRTLRTGASSSFQALFKTCSKSLLGFRLSFTLAWSSDASKRCGLAYSSCCQLLSVSCGTSPAPFRSLQLVCLLLTNIIAALVDCLKSVSNDSHYSSDHCHTGHVPSARENPAVFCSWCWFWKHEWLRISGSQHEFVSSAQCLHWNKPLWSRYSFPRCLLRDVSLFDSIFSNIYLRQRLANWTAGQFMNWRVHRADTYFLSFCEFCTTLDEWVWFSLRA